MSSRALTSDDIRMMYAYNMDQGRTNIKDFSISKAKDQWGNPRRRLLVHAVVTLAFTCLMRIDEVLHLTFEDIIFHPAEHIEINLFSTKTHPFGGLFLCIAFLHSEQLSFVTGSRPYHLWLFPKSDEALCPVLALGNWIMASGLRNSSIYIAYV